MKLLAIAEKVGGTLIGDDKTITGLSTLDDITEGSLVFIQDESLLAKVEDSAAAAILVNDKISQSSKALIQVKNPKAVFFALIPLFYPPKSIDYKIAKSAVIDKSSDVANQVSIAENVVIGKNCQIQQDVIIHAGVVLGDNITLSKGVILHPNVTIYDDTVIGESSVIHANSVIGADGFGYVFDGEKHQKIPHLGRVVIGQNVEVGANVVVDRATMGETVIGDGTKIDNLVQVAHNVKLGKNNILCAFTGVAGSSSCGDNVVLAANVGIADHATIEDNVTLGARSGVASGKTIKAGSKMLGAPARDMDKAIEIMMSTQRLPQMRKLLQSLQKRISLLEKEKEA